MSNRRFEMFTIRQILVRMRQECCATLPATSSPMTDKIHEPFVSVQRTHPCGLAPIRVMRFFPVPRQEFVEPFIGPGG